MDKKDTTTLLTYGNTGAILCCAFYFYQQLEKTKGELETSRNESKQMIANIYQLVKSQNETIEKLKRSMSDFTEKTEKTQAVCSQIESNFTQFTPNQFVPNNMNNMNNMNHMNNMNNIIPKPILTQEDEDELILKQLSEKSKQKI